MVWGFKPHLHQTLTRIKGNTDLGWIFIVSLIPVGPGTNYWISLYLGFPINKRCKPSTYWWKNWTWQYSQALNTVLTQSESLDLMAFCCYHLHGYCVVLRIKYYNHIISVQYLAYHLAYNRCVFSVNCCFCIQHLPLQTVIFYYKSSSHLCLQKRGGKSGGGGKGERIGRRSD